MSKTIIVLSCFYEPYISGAERFVKEITERLISNYRFIIITSRIKIRNPKFEIRNIGGNEYLIKRVGFGSRFDKWLYPILAPIAALFVHIREKKIVAVHAVMESYAGIALMIYKKLNPKAKTILTLQSGDLDEKAAQGKFPAWLWKKIHTAPDYLTAISSYLKNRAVKLGVPENKISIIPNGVDLKKLEIGYCPDSIEDSRRCRRKLEISPRRIVCVARLSPEKGLEYLLDALPLVKREFGDVELVLIGGGILENDLRAQANQLGISDSVSFLGAQRHEAALAEMARAEVFVCPSLAEGLGIVFIEAQAVGVPVIGTNVGGIPDVIKDGETGLLVPPRSSRAIADAVIKIFQNKELAHKLVGGAKKELHRFDWDRIAFQVSEIYNL